VCGAVSASPWLAVVPEEYREVVAGAVADATIGEPSSCAPVTGGASGALTYRVETPRATHLVRIETARDYFRNPERSYACMLAAAKVGVAPAVHHADVETGVAVMDFIETRPLETFPGGVERLVAACGRLIATLQTAEAFPHALDDFGTLVARMLDVVDEAGILRGGALDQHRTLLEEMRAVYPWQESPQVSTHNDVNPLNVLFDGTRLWLVDWELAFLNDAFADVAIVANNWGESPEGQELLLTAWLGREPTVRERSRLTLMRQFSRLFYAGITLSGFRGVIVDDDSPSMTFDELRHAFETGALGPGPDALFAIGKTNLRAFLDAAASAAVADAFDVLR
jgi:aminoglycoside phosphotransferase (APT) family kinase protein